MPGTVITWMSVREKPNDSGAGGRTLPHPAVLGGDGALTLTRAAADDLLQWDGQENSAARGRKSLILLSPLEASFPTQTPCSRPARCGPGLSPHVPPAPSCGLTHATPDSEPRSPSTVLGRRPPRAGHLGAAGGSPSSPPRRPLRRWSPASGHSCVPATHHAGLECHRVCCHTSNTLCFSIFTT